MLLQDKIEIHASAAKVFATLSGLLHDEESYRLWNDGHFKLQWVKGRPLEKNSVVYIEEKTGEVVQNLKFRFIRIIPDELIIYRVLFPLSLFAPENRFEIQSTGKNSCIFTATGKINMSEKMFLKMHKAHKAKLEGALQHMKEEGQKINELAEAS